jgi:hypothetical protein
VLFSTDWQISARGFVVLDDDRRLQPAENVTPVVRSEIVTTYGDRFVDAVNAVSANLTTIGLRELNSLVGLKSGTVAQVAAAWLRSRGLLQSGPGPRNCCPSQEGADSADRLHESGRCEQGGRRPSVSKPCRRRRGKQPASAA